MNYFLLQVIVISNELLLKSNYPITEHPYHHLHVYVHSPLKMYMLSHTDFQQCLMNLYQERKKGIINLYFVVATAYGNGKYPVLPFFTKYDLQLVYKS